MRLYLLVTVNKVLKKAILTDKVYAKEVRVKVKDKVYKGVIRFLETSIPRSMLSPYYLIVPINEKDLESLRKNRLEIKAMELVKVGREKE